IWICGICVANGYNGDHERENAAFVRMPDGTVVYHSGDLGYRDATGDFVFCHRKDRQIMIYGKRVEIAEVESRLYQCNGVQQAVVTTYNDKNDLPFMVAYVVYDDTTNIGRIKVELAKHLPSYMIPEYFIRLQAIPLNDHGKPETDKLIGACKAGFIQWMLKYDRQIFQKLTCC
ncbi:MAG: AMP-binding protein, partial [Eggerthellaceae bacterium]|nr:AMP-binding protein [Eggerthellaceae bacterium]